MTNTNVANFFWVGNISIYEKLSIKSFIDNGFNVNLWTYQDSLKNKRDLVGMDINICDASNILEKDLMHKFSQGKQKSNPASFANLFRLELLKKEGGWWFDLDCICLKDVSEFENLTSTKEYIIGCEYENYVGNSVLYFRDNKLLEDLIKEVYKEIDKNNFNFYWGQIGPDLISNFLLKKNLINEAVDQKYFYDISAKEFDMLLKVRGEFREVQAYFDNDALVCHLWNEMFKKHIYNKNYLPPKNSLLDKFFERHMANQLEDKKRYSRMIMLRFLPLFSKFYKIIYRLKILIKNNKNS